MRCGRAIRALVLVGPVPCQGCRGRVWWRITAAMDPDAMAALLIVLLALLALIAHGTR